MQHTPCTLIGILLATFGIDALAAETPIGQAVGKNGMEIGAVYLQSVVMEPAMPSEDNPSDIHLEADIHAVKGNPNGFGVGEWIPSLQVAFHLSKEGSSWEKTGMLMPMVASDGPHYGANVKMDGSGKYHLTYHINPPPYNGFVRHIDKETGVGKWWEPFDISWNFTYLGTGKKGGY
jgi:periplasmic iron binding protein